MRNKKRKCITKKEDKENKEASVKKIENTSKSKKNAEIEEQD